MAGLPWRRRAPDETRLRVRLSVTDRTYAVAYQRGGLEGGTPSRVNHPAAGRRSQRGKERRPAGGRALACARLADCARDRGRCAVRRFGGSPEIMDRRRARRPRPQVRRANPAMWARRPRPQVRRANPAMGARRPRPQVRRANPAMRARRPRPQVRRANPAMRARRPRSQVWRANPAMRARRPRPQVRRANPAMRARRPRSQVKCEQ